ncbi:MAG: HEPN domain-containing protein [Clostridiales bacterium]|nr:HEPN domain-containing protein [Clostridiales bacterium]
MGLKTYYEFAEADYNFLRDAYEQGIFSNSCGAIAQNVCERYMKHVIQEYCTPETETEWHDKESILRTHSLKRLIRYIEDNFSFVFDRSAKTEIQVIDGYYFSTRYPGDDSVELTQEDIGQCMEAMRLCRGQVDQIIELCEKTNDSQ